MTPQQLKNSILQMAMQGKLVEQRPEEGTGEELYQQIQKEKQKLIKEGKIKKQKPLPEITEEEVPFEIPESWKWVRLGSVINLLSGADLTPDKYNSEQRGIVYITGASCIDEDHILINRWTEYPNNIAHKGDILLTCKGTVGKTAILDIEQAHIARQIMAITPIICDADYLTYYLQLIVKSLKKKAKSMIPGIDRESVLYGALPLPPLAEQKRIVAKIEEIMPYIDRYAVAYDHLQSYSTRFPDDLKKSILQMAIQGKLVPQDPNDEPASVLLEKIAKEKQKLIKEGKIKKQKPLPPIKEEEIPFDIPESWVWVRMNDCLDVRDGTHDTPKYYAKGYPLVTSKNLRDGKIDFSTCKLICKGDFDEINKRSKVDDKDILFAMIGTVGNPVLFRGKSNFSIKNMALFKHIGDFLDMEYVYWLFIFIQDDIKKQASGGVQNFVSLNFLRNYLIPLPPLAEQKRIVAKLDELLPQIDSLK